MFHQQDYDLSRQKYQEYTSQFGGLYVPIGAEKPSLIRRLLAALRGTSFSRAPQPGAKGESRMVRAGVVTK